MITRGRPSQAALLVAALAAALVAATVAGVALVGCAGPDDGTPTSAGATAGVSGTAPPSTADPVASSPTPTTSSVPAVPSTAASGGSTGTGSGCPRGAGSSAAWASWPMPNPKGLGLPNPASYTDLGNGTVRDNVTCLVWQRQPAPSPYTWAAATGYCSALSLGGYSDWHLPSRVELTSLTDPTRAGPSIDTAAFPGTPVAFFWTSTPWAVAHTPPYAWIINFYEGLASNAADQNGAYRVRCVRSPGGSGTATYRAVGTGEVQDTRTGLVWQQATSATTMSAADAAGYCRGLALGGHTWRLPTIKELATTVDDSRVAPAINRTVFPDTAKATWYWSSSTAKPDPTLTWALSYDDGYTNYRKAATGLARCLR